MLVDLGLLLAGLVVLYFGAEWLVRGASSIAISMGLKPLIVGLTVVALGTSLPELVTNLLAAAQGEHSLALGNILGSNIANVGLILGLTALLLPIAVADSTLRKEFPILLAVQLVFFILALDGTISRVDGIILVAILLGFMAYLVRDARRTSVAPDDSMASPGFTLPRWKKGLLVGGGIVGLAVGAHLMVMGAVNIAHAFGINPIIVGLTIVAIGTSLPELAASIVAVIHKQADLTVGNVIGSNLMNVLFVVGLVAILTPLNVESEALTIHFPVMIAFCLLMALAWPQRQFSRVVGAVLLCAFIGYTAYLVVPLM